MKDIRKHLILEFFEKSLKEKDVALLAPKSFTENEKIVLKFAAKYKECGTWMDGESFLNEIRGREWDNEFQRDLVVTYLNLLLEGYTK